MLKIIKVIKKELKIRFKQRVKLEQKKSLKLKTEL